MSPEVPTVAAPYAMPRTQPWAELIRVSRRLVLEPEPRKLVCPPEPLTLPKDQVETACSASRVHTQRSRLANLKRTSCQAVPVALAARRIRTPSANASTRPPFSNPSMVSEPSCRGANASGR